MKMMTGATVVLFGSCIIAAPAPAAQEPTSTDAGLPRVAPHGGMSVARAAHQTTILGSGKVLITGGCDDGGCDRELASAEIYDPAIGSFGPVAPMATPRRDHVATMLLDGRVLVAGGWAGGPKASTEIYDPASGRWTSAGDMLEARSGAIAVPLSDGRVLIGGGRAEMGGALASVEIFDPATSTFSPAGTMRTPRRRPAAVALSDGTILVSGGQGTGGEFLRSAEIFDPATGEFRVAGDMAVPRATHATVLLPNGRVLIVGGASTSATDRGRGDRQVATEIYDPGTGEFSAGPDMHSSRRKIRDSVVILPSGAVLVAGGSGLPEIWDPADGSLMQVQGELEGRHEFATATLLHTGKVLVLGGYDERIRPSASAWLVQPVR